MIAIADQCHERTKYLQDLNWGAWRCFYIPVAWLDAPDFGPVTTVAVAPSVNRLSTVLDTVTHTIAGPSSSLTITSGVSMLNSGTVCIIDSINNDQACPI